MPALTDVRFAKLRGLSHTGSTSDMLLQWLQANGATSPSISDAWIEYLAAAGFGPTGELKPSGDVLVANGTRYVDVPPVDMSGGGSVSLYIIYGDGTIVDGSVPVLTGVAGVLTAGANVSNITLDGVAYAGAVVTAGRHARVTFDISAGTVDAFGPMTTGAVSDVVLTSGSTKVSYPIDEGRWRWVDEGTSRNWSTKTDASWEWSTSIAPEIFPFLVNPTFWTTTDNQPDSNGGISAVILDKAAEVGGDTYAIGAYGIWGYSQPDADSAFQVRDACHDPLNDYPTQYYYSAIDVKRDVTAVQHACVAFLGAHYSVAGDVFLKNTGTYVMIDPRDLSITQVFRDDFAATGEVDVNGSIYHEIEILSADWIRVHLYEEFYSTQNGSEHYIVSPRRLVYPSIAAIASTDPWNDFNSNPAGVLTVGRPMTGATPFIGVNLAYVDLPGPTLKGFITPNTDWQYIQPFNIGQRNDNRFNQLRSLGHTGSLNDMEMQFWAAL